jgi:hypothetical protein
MTGADLAQEYLAVPLGDLPGETLKSGAHVKPSRRRNMLRNRERQAKKVERIGDSAINILKESGIRFRNESEMRNFLAQDVKQNRTEYGIGFIEAFFIQKLVMWIITKIVQYLFDKYRQP